MQKIPALNQNNQALEIEIIRYFKKDDKKYLIFTLGETDEQGYVKIYVSKILGLNGTLAAYDIIDETEWANVRELVKRIVKTNREGGNLEIEDLSQERLTNLKINGQQGFKLISNLVELLGANVNEVQDEVETTVSNSEPVVETLKEENEEIAEEPVSVEATLQTSPKIESTSEYQKLYQDLFEKYQQVIEENAKLKTQLSNIKAIINE